MLAEDIESRGRTPRARVAGSAVAMVATIALTAVFLAGLHAPAGADEPADRLTVERILGEPSVFTPLPSGITWVGDGSGVSCIETVDTTHALVVYDVPGGERREIRRMDEIAVPEDLRGDDGGEFAIGSYTWDAQGRRIAFVFRGELFTMEAASARVTRHTTTDGTETDPTFSPDGSRIAYTRDHDLYVLDIESGEETRLTSSGSDTVLNGILSWVYMEELFTRGDKRAFWWSPDGERIAFLESRTHNVPEFPIVDNIPIHATTTVTRYPKAGDPNPIVRVGIVRAGGGDVNWANIDTGEDSYFARVHWLGDGRTVVIEHLNRDQDSLAVLFADVRTGRIEQVLTETSVSWVNVTYLRHFYEGKRQFLWGSERDGSSQLYLYNPDGSMVRQVTGGDVFEVTELNGVTRDDTEYDSPDGGDVLGRHTIFFTANKDNVIERHLYAVNDYGGSSIRRITSEPGTHRVTMSPDCRYYIDRFSSHERPTRIAVHSADGAELFALGDRWNDTLASFDLAFPEFFTIDRDGRTYHCMMTKPTDFDPTRKYPVIVYTYGGPHAQVVRDAWSSRTLWNALMAQRGFIVFSLDNRGSFGRGHAWESMVLRNLGRFELMDQVLGVEYLKTLPYVDPERIGIWGWSYGGYMTLMAMFKAGDVFKAGVSVAPVTDWRLYDTIYTERYMKHPDDNPDGYRESSPLNFADGLKGPLLIMHGDADDNVHFQNTVKVVDELIEAGKDFDMMMYPQRRHGISGTERRIHLYGKMTRFFEEHLGRADSRPMP